MLRIAAPLLACTALVAACAPTTSGANNKGTSISNYYYHTDEWKAAHSSKSCEELEKTELALSEKAHGEAIEEERVRASEKGSGRGGAVVVLPNTPLGVGAGLSIDRRVDVTSDAAVTIRELRMVQELRQSKCS